MERIAVITAGLILMIIWFDFLSHLYAAWKNKRYRTAAICMSAFIVTVASFVAMFVYGDFISLFNGTQDLPAQVNEAVLCTFGFVTVAGHLFCWWYIYGRRSIDFLRIKNLSADDLEKLISPEVKEFLGLN